MDHSPRFSIITVNLNNILGLRKTIENVVCQTFTDYEYVIIDGGSTDGSVEVIQEFADKITYWVSEADKGIYNAMNKGIDVAKGDFICFLNSGDEFFSKYSLQLLAGNITDSKAELFFGNFITINEITGKTIYWDVSYVRDRSDLLPHTFLHNATFYSRNLFERIGRFNERFKICADLDWYMNAMINHQVSFQIIPVLLSVFNGGRGISSVQMDLHKYERAVLFQKYFSGFEIALFSGRTYQRLKKSLLFKFIFHLFFRLKLNKQKRPTFR
jgi:glycosyltransferase involved in cell wall biosynthesis